MRISLRRSTALLTLPFTWRQLSTLLTKASCCLTRVTSSSWNVSSRMLPEMTPYTFLNRSWCFKQTGYRNTSFRTFPELLLLQRPETVQNALFPVPSTCTRYSHIPNLNIKAAYRHVLIPFKYYKHKKIMPGS